MLFGFYYKTIKPVSMILFYVLIGLLISILVVNNKLLDAVDKNDDKKFKENLKIQKGLIWTNFSIIVLFFLYLLIISFYFFTSRFQQIYNRRKGVMLRNILLFCLIVIFSGLTYYVDKSINKMNTLNAKDEGQKSIISDELKKIYIIIPIVSIIALSLLMYNFSKTDSALTYMNNYLTYYQFDDIPSMTRTSSPTLSNLSDDDDELPEYFRDNFPNRYSPSDNE